MTDISVQGSYELGLQQLKDEIVARDREIERLREAMQKIIAEADSDDGLTAWDGADIARRALEQKP